MGKFSLLLYLILIGLLTPINQLNSQSLKKEKSMFEPLSFKEADQKADSLLTLMTPDEKIALVGGDRFFFIRPFPRLNLTEVYISDATQGIHRRESFRNIDLSEYQLEKSTAFPCPLLLAATWNTDLSYKYAEAVGEEFRAGGIGFILGPGMNIYRQSQCGRNFEYFGEDPFLVSSMIAHYVRGAQSTGTAVTLKHFVANNTDYFRRKSNSIVDERSLHEIYLPAFKAGIDAGAAAVMTSYNLLNGEWCGQSAYVINDLLKTQLGFTGLIMTDWWCSADDGEKLSKSGQDLEMPYAIALHDAQTLIDEGKVKVEDIDRMAKSILRTCLRMKLYDRKKEPAYEKYQEHESVALQTAREGIVLLKNDGGILPIKTGVKNILLTGDFVDRPAFGGGSARVEGYNQKIMLDELQRIFGERLSFEKNPTPDQIRSADVVVCNVGTMDSEGYDRPFELPEDQESRAEECAQNNPNTVVIVTSGSGIRMTGWSSRARAILYAWYGGQTGNQALAEIISGAISPSGKLPITIEKDFKDSPGYGYMPDGETLYTGWNADGEKAHPVYDVHYTEGVFAGYRWYESRHIEPLYPFGHGLTYTSFEYSDITLSKEKVTEQDTVLVTFTLKNTGSTEGSEVAQLYIQDVESSVPRPVKELKGFQKVHLMPGQTAIVRLSLEKKGFSFWNPTTKNWFAEKGKFIVHVGSSSKDIRLTKELELL